MSKSLLKIISLSLILVLVAPMCYDAFNARIVFAEEGVKGDLPFEKVNKDLYFRMVELCWPKYIQKLIRWLANWAIDKVGEGILSAIPGVGELLAKMWDKIEVFRDKVDFPIFPRCDCKNEKNTHDSAWLPLNWMFSQHYIKEHIKDDRMTKQFPQWEGKQHPMFLSADVKTVGTTWGWPGEKIKSHSPLANATDNFKSSLKKYDSFIASGTEDFYKVYPDYSGFTSVIDEQQRLADRWRQNQIGYMKFMNTIAELTFHNVMNWRESAFNDIFSAVNRDIPFDKKTPKEEDNEWWDPLEWFKEIKKVETSEDKKNMSLGQNVALQRVTVSVKLLDEQIDANFHTAFALNEVTSRAMQNKKSTRQAFHKNVDLMGHHAATTPKKTASRKVKLGFN